MFDESKRRPLYFIKNYVPAPAAKKHERSIGGSIPETFLSPLP
jgi:hypothetical protein